MLAIDRNQRGPPSRTACMNSGRTLTSASLFASRMRLPACAAARLDGSRRADDRSHDRVDPGCAAISLKACSPVSTSVRRAGAAQLQCQKRSCWVNQRRRRIAADVAGIAPQTRDVVARGERTSAIDRDDARARPSVFSRCCPWSPAPRLAAACSSRQAQAFEADQEYTGAARVTLSTRSSKPPWPGGSRPLSFNPA